MSADNTLGPAYNEFRYDEHRTKTDNSLEADISCGQTRS